MYITLSPPLIGYYFLVMLHCPVYMVLPLKLVGHTKLYCLITVSSALLLNGPFLPHPPSASPSVPGKIVSPFPFQTLCPNVSIDAGSHWFQRAMRAQGAPRKVGCVPWSDTGSVLNLINFMWMVVIAHLTGVVEIWKARCLHIGGMGMIESPSWGSETDVVSVLAGPVTVSGSLHLCVQHLPCSPGVTVYPTS